MEKLDILDRQLPAFSDGLRRLPRTLQRTAENVSERISLQLLIQSG